VKLLTIADRYAVGSLLGAAARALKALPLTVELCEMLMKIVGENLLRYRAVLDVVTNAGSFIQATFKDVQRTWKGPAFLALTKESVRLLLESESLIADSEEDIFRGVLDWLRAKYDSMEERRVAMMELSQFIRFGRMTGENIADMVLHAPEMQEEACQKRVMDGLLFAAASDGRKYEQMVNSNLFREREGIKAAHHKITVVGILPPHFTLGSELLVGTTDWEMSLAPDPDNNEKLILSLEPTPEDSVDFERSLRMAFFAKAWPEGLWVLVGPLTDITVTTTTIAVEEDPFKMSREDILNSKKWLDKDGQIHCKVRFRILDV
jgi:hypothetical protein